jgi:hypothetical protein
MQAAERKDSSNGDKADDSAKTAEEVKERRALKDVPLMVALGGRSEFGSDQACRDTLSPAPARIARRLILA